jgi:hypothetical protein
MSPRFIKLSIPKKDHGQGEMKFGQILDSISQEEKSWTLQLQSIDFKEMAKDEKIQYVICASQKWWSRQ